MSKTASTNGRLNDLQILGKDKAEPNCRLGHRLHFLDTSLCYLSVNFPIGRSLVVRLHRG